MSEIINKDGHRVVAWSCILTDEEMALIANGCDPRLIRPDKLTYYATLPYQEYIKSKKENNVA